MLRLILEVIFPDFLALTEVFGANFLFFYLWRSVFFRKGVEKLLFRRVFFLPVLFGFVAQLCQHLWDAKFKWTMPGSIFTHFS